MEKFIEHLQGQDHAKTTQKAYLRCVNLFLGWLQKEPAGCTKKDVLKYLEYLQKQKGQENITRRNALIAINHYFSFLLKNEEVQSNPTALIKIRGAQKRQLYRTYTPEELERLHDNYHHNFVRNFNDLCFAPSHGGIPANQRAQTLLARQRNHVMFGLLVYQGVTTKEIEKVLLQDVDLTKATIKIRGGKKSNERTIPLNALQIGSLINYTENIRPQFFTYRNETEKLFFALPESSKDETDSENLMYTFKPLTKHVKSIDKNFVNFKQVRASVITYWIKAQGLRKAQYLAGHRHITSTENYLPNGTENLTDDIAKYNPF